MNLQTVWPGLRLSTDHNLGLQHESVVFHSDLFVFAAALNQRSSLDSRCDEFAYMLYIFADRLGETIVMNSTC